MILKQFMLALVFSLVFLANPASAQSAAELNGDWQGENSGNRVRIEMSGNDVTVGAVSNNPGQSSGATLWVARGSGQYTYAFPGGQIARMELIGPERIRVTNPDGWTDTFRRYSKPAASAKAAAAPAPSTDCSVIWTTSNKSSISDQTKYECGMLTDLMIDRLMSEGKIRPIGSTSVPEPPTAEVPALITERSPGKSVREQLLFGDESKPPQPDSARYWLSGRVKAPAYVCSRDFCFQIPIRIRLFTNNELVGLVDAAYSSGDGGRFVFSQPLEAGLTWRAEITQQDPNGIYDCKVAGSSEVGTVGVYPEALHPNTARDVVEVNCTMSTKGKRFLEVTTSPGPTPVR